MTGAVYVSVVTLLGLILQVGNRDGDAPLALFGRIIDLVEGHVPGKLSRGQHFGDGRRQGRLAVVNVSDGSHVHMRLGSLEFPLCHVLLWLLPHAMIWLGLLIAIVDIVALYLLFVKHTTSSPKS